MLEPLMKLCVSDSGHYCQCKKGDPCYKQNMHEVHDRELAQEAIIAELRKEIAWLKDEICKLHDRVDECLYIASL